MLSYSHSPGHHMTLHDCHSHSPAIIATINALGKSNSIQNLNITDLHGHLLFDSSKDTVLLAGVDDTDDDTSFAGVHDEDTSLARVPVSGATIMTIQMTTQTQNLVTTWLTPTIRITIQAKHPYTAPEATYHSQCN